MDESEARSLFDAISERLTDLGYQWIVDSVTAAISEGQTEPKRISASSNRRSDQQLRLSGFDDQVNELNDGNAGNFFGQQPYNHTEEAKLLIDAIDAVFTSTWDMKKVVIETLREDESNITEVQFTDEDAEHPLFIINDEEIEGQSNIVNSLDRHVNAMREKTL